VKGKSTGKAKVPPKSRGKRKALQGLPPFDITFLDELEDAADDEISQHTQRRYFQNSSLLLSIEGKKQPAAGSVKKKMKLSEISSSEKKRRQELMEQHRWSPHVCHSYSAQPL
jgi:hypothetical protein